MGASESDHRVTEYRDVSFAYPEAKPALSKVDLGISRGEVVLVLGGSSSGKSTLLRCANGLVPHASGGTFSGTVTTAGRSTLELKPRDFADVVGLVQQDPEAHFVVDEVERDIAFALENLGMDQSEMRRRVEEILDALDIAHLRHRSPATLSGGEKQRCAIAGALASGPDLLVLDEPTSQLDPQGADDVLAAIGRLNTDLGVTVIIAEHRLERAGSLADCAVMMAEGRITQCGKPADVIASYPGAPPVTHLGLLLGWDPLPLTVRDALIAARSQPLTLKPAPRTTAEVSRGDVLVAARGVDVALGGSKAISDISLELAQGEVLAVMGRNGAGKTTLLKALAGLATPARGSVEAAVRCAYVPQDPNSLLFSATVRKELEETLRLLRRPDDGSVDGWLASLGINDLADRHPRALSGGERQRVAIAAVAVGGAPVLLLDEPTRGIDAPSRDALEIAIREHAATGGAVAIATHDVELAARCATRVAILAEGEMVAEGDARKILAGSLFAPQVLRVLPPFMTVGDVKTALGQ
ncbi:MAG: hypothetical protein DCC49_10780 [Acidobacteria bacterium]|nr:MAG: hypothetical protein DCC49_10780 [Acidobacteriota bacterium]